LDNKVIDIIDAQLKPWRLSHNSIHRNSILCNL